MRLFLSALCAVYAAQVFAAEKTTIDFNYKQVDILKVIEDYAKASGQKFIVAPGVRGRITITNSGPDTLPEAYNQMSLALALNSVGISKQEDVSVVNESRNIQRDLIDVGPELPALKPEKMFTWVINLKYSSADEINKQLRILTSKDGELVPYVRTNQILVTDWVSNLYRIAKIIKEIDVPVSKTAKVEKKSKTEKE